MLDEKDEEYQKRKERARQLRNSVGMITANDMQNIGTDNITTINNDNSYIEKLNRAKQLRNSVGFITSNDQMIDEQQNNPIIKNTIDQPVEANGIDLSKYPDLEPGDSVEKTVIGLNKKDIAGIQQYGDSEETQKKKEIYNMVSNSKTEHAIDTKNTANSKTDTNAKNILLRSPLIKEQTKNSKVTSKEIYNLVTQKNNNKVEIIPELTQELANMNDREKNVYIDTMTNDKEEKANINIKIHEYKQAQKAQKESEKIDQDIQKGNYISSLWHIIKGLPQEGINAVTKTIISAGSLMPQLKDDMSKNNYLDTAKVVTGEYNETNSKIKNNIVRTLGSVSGTIGAMIPSILANIIAPGSGNLTQAVTVGSSEYLDTLNEDNSNKGQALLTGILKGAASYQIEKIAGGNFLSKGSLDDIAHGTIANKFSNKYAQRIASILYDIGGEVAEEQIENQVGYIIDKIVSDKDITAEQWWSDFSETNKNTVLTTIVLGMFGLGGNTYREVLNEKQLKEIDSKTEKSIKEITTIMDKENITIKKPYFVLDTDWQGNISTLTQTIGQEIELKNTNLNVTPVVVYQNGYYDVIDGKSGTKLDTSGYTSVDEAINGFNDKISKASKESIDMVNNEVVNSKLALINKFQEVEAYQKMYNNDVRNYKNSSLEDNTKLEEISTLTNQIQDKTIYNNQEAVDIFDYVSSYFDNMKIEHTNIGKDFLYSVDQNGKIINSFELSDKRYNGKKIKEIINTAVDGVLPNLIQTTTEQNTNNLDIEPTNYIANNQTGLKMEDRTLQNVSSKKVKPYQMEYPEVADEIQEMAWNFQEDLANSIEGKRYKVGDEWTGQKRNTTKELAEIKDETGASWNKISLALEDIANNKGNYALAKKIELVLDRALTEGYRNIYGQTIFPNESYLDKKSKIEGKDYKNTETDYDASQYMSDEELRPFGEKTNKKGQLDVEGNQVRNMKKNKNNIAKSGNIKYNINGIKLGKREYANVTSLINTNKTNNIGMDSIFSANYFYIYENKGFDNNNIIAKIEIEGNEDLIKGLRKEIANGTIKRTKTISSILQEFRDVRKSDNSNNVSSERERKNEQTDRLYTRGNRQGREIRQRQNSNTSIGNKSGIVKEQNNTQIKLDSGTNLQILSRDTNTGIVYTDGKYVYKNTTSVNNKGVNKKTIEMQVYNDLKNNHNVLKAELVKVNDKDMIRTQKANVLSVDTIEKGKRTSLGKHVLNNNRINQIINAVNDLTNRGYIYGDNLQIALLGTDAKLMDFSNSQLSKDNTFDVVKKNYKNIVDFLTEFGHLGEAEIIDNAINMMDILKIVDNDNKVFLQDTMYYKKCEDIIDNIINDKAEINNVYYVKNQREIPKRENSNEIYSSDKRINDCRILFTNTPLSKKFQDNWEITPIYQTELNKNNTSNDDIRSMKKPSLKVEYDSQGRQLSRQQQKHFKYSKIRDEKR